MILNNSSSIKSSVSISSSWGTRRRRNIQWNMMWWPFRPIGLNVTGSSMDRRKRVGGFPLHLKPQCQQTLSTRVEISDVVEPGPTCLCAHWNTSTLHGPAVNTRTQGSWLSIGSLVRFQMAHVVPTATGSLTPKVLSIQTHSLKSSLHGNFQMDLLCGITYETFEYDAVWNLAGF